MVQRQLWLIHHRPELTRAQVYDQARKEFYDLRLQEEVRRHVAKEEAMATGAYFGKSLITIGAEFEDKEFQRWKKWAEKRSGALQQEQHAGSAAIIDDPNNSQFEPELDAEPESEVEETQVPE